MIGKALETRTALVVVQVVILALLVTGQAYSQQSASSSVPVTLAGYLRQVIHSNPTVEEGWLQWLIKSRQARAATGAFEPTLDAAAKLNGLKQQNTALQQYQQLGAATYDQTNTAYSLGLKGLLPTGTTYDLSTSLTRLQDTYSEQGQYQSSITINAQQPLLKGFTHGAPTASIRTAAEDRIIAFQQYRTQLMKIITQAETVYWNLAFAQDADRIAAGSVRTAQYLLQVAQKGVGVGTMSDLDVQQAQAELSSRLATKADSDLSVSDAENALRRLIGPPKDTGRTTFVASDPIAADAGRTINLNAEADQLIAWAHRAQPDYMIAQEQLAREKIVVGYREDQALPELNLTGSLGLTGLGTTVSDSLNNLSGGSYPDWSVGVEMKIPVALGITQRNDLKAEQLKQDLATVQERAARDDMDSSIRNLVQDVSTLAARLKNARQVSDAKKQLLNIAVARLKNGTVGLVDVYKAQDVLDTAQSQTLQAIVKYRQAAMQLEMASGTVLKDQGLEALQDGQVQLSESLRSR